MIRNVLITGASRGIGLGLVKNLLTHLPEARVVATCRNPSTATELSELSNTFSKDRLLVLPLNVTDFESHKKVVDCLAEEGVTNLDVVIANAGIASDGGENRAINSTGTDMLNVFNTNVVGSMLSMQAYHKLLCAGRSKLLMVVSSVLASIEMTPATGGCMTSYRTSKAALNMLATVYAEDADVRAAGAKVVALHPGWVQTDMGQSGGRKAPVTVDDSVSGIVSVIQAAADVQGGAPSVDSVSPYAEFQKKLQDSNCVFVGFDGKLYPW